MTVTKIMSTPPNGFRNFRMALIQKGASHGMTIYYTSGNTFGWVALQYYSRRF
jgi:hypothetical protein